MSEAQISAKANVETWGALINGEFRPAASGKTFPTFNPGNGEVIAYLAECDEEDIDAAVRAALAAYPGLEEEDRRRPCQAADEAGAARGGQRPEARRARSRSTPASRSAIPRQSMR